MGCNGEDAAANVRDCVGLNLRYEHFVFRSGSGGLRTDAVALAGMMANAPVRGWAQHASVHSGADSVDRRERRH